MCTILYASDRKIALGGNNEDYTNAQTKVWFVPTEGGEIDGTPFRPGYGRVYFGHDEWHIQGGMNDQGLFFDMVAVQPAYVPKFGINGSEFKGSLQDVFMAECASVEEVLAYVSGLTFVEKWTVGILVGDKTGASAIIEPFGFIRKQGKYQVATNFWQSITKPEKYTCQRHKIAVSMLEGADNISIALIRRVLAAVHQEGDIGGTLYSNIYDLEQGIVYLYHFHNFENEVVIELEEELSKGFHFYDLPSLFPKTYAAELFRQRAAQC